MPATGVIPNAGVTQPGRVDHVEDENEDDEVILHTRVLRKPTKKPAPKDIVALAKARLREVKAEIRRMKKLEHECAELERLIQAAENKPLALVKQLKRSAG